MQIIHQMWERNDIRGVLSAMERMGDHAVSTSQLFLCLHIAIISMLMIVCFFWKFQVCADMASVLMERSEIITLDLCTSILPVVTDLLESKTDRYLLQRL